MKMKLFLLAGFIMVQAALFAQEKAPENWFNLDPTADKVQGVSTEKMYKELLKGKSPKQVVVVAVIDSGVEADHEDLQSIMWVNEDEIPGNNKDDDNNGYVDDIHGWNFIGGKDGRNVLHDNLEIARLVAKYRKMYEGKNPESLSKKERKEYEKYQEMEKKVKEEREKGEKNYELYSGMMKNLQKLKEAIGKEEITATDVEAFETEDEDIMKVLPVVKNVMGKGASFQDLENDLQGAIDYFETQYKYHYNPDFDPRHIVGDNYSDSYEKGYGNNDVEGPDAAHGTHVAGIIGAVRNNGVGIDGVSNTVRIMSIRAVPDGDERDKDVANAIIYAVDNGASIINMSFGKGYAWDKEAVDKAVKYAEKHDVLMVHAAGNSSQDNDEASNYPNDKYKKAGWFSPKTADNWLEIGALSWKGGEKSVAGFSNYGKGNVDVFSPGVDIYSTIPDQGYASFSGTSMASPVTAGVAAVIRSYFPELTAEQVKEVIMESTVPLEIQVQKPGSDETVPFSELSRTGGVVNVYKAVTLAGRKEGTKRNWKDSKQAKAAGSAAMNDNKVVRP